ncbi:MAG: LytTR family DNA-binding domain-containing protein [Bacteroidota bacterium]
MRIHRSYIVNMDRVESLMGNSVQVTVKGKQQSLPVGKSYRDQLGDKVEENKL